MNTKINEADYLAGVNEANYQQLLTMYQAVQKERDELKAQVEQLRKASMKVFFNYNNNLSLVDVMKELSKVIDATPTQCLSTHDAKIKGQGAKEFVEWYINNSDLTDIDIQAKEFANKLRQQAKGE